MHKKEIPFFKRLLKSKLLIVAEILVLVFFSTALVKEIVRKHSVEKEVSQLQQELSKLEQQNVELSGLVEYFDSDIFKEEQARLKLGLQKPGESVVAVLGESIDLTDINNNSNLLALNSDGKKISNPQRWWSYFFSTKTEKIINNLENNN